jgi:hypothetical protein
MWYSYNNRATLNICIAETYVFGVMNYDEGGVLRKTGMLGDIRPQLTLGHPLFLRPPHLYYCGKHEDKFPNGRKN